jgi:uncharacterized repeat protein (TIGR03803 family)
MTRTLLTLVSFNSSNGITPLSNLIMDGNGDLFGTTNQGGANGDGTVFEITNSGGSYAIDPTTLVSFDGINGNRPYGGLVIDSSGNLYGTTTLGGTSNQGTIFEIVNNGVNYSSIPTVLASFNGPSGHLPFADLIADANGNLFGTADGGGAIDPLNGFGTVFELQKSNGTYASTLSTIVSFNNTDGAYPYSSGLVADANGDLFGTTSVGGAHGVYGYGTVFEIVKTNEGYASAPITLVNFDGLNGADCPTGTLIMDSRGDLFGTTTGGSYGGSPYGAVFEIVKTDAGYSSTPLILASFNGSNGDGPYGGLIADANGNLFGTTSRGGANGDGTVFELARSGAGYDSTPIVLANFDGTNGAFPYGSLIADDYGNLFGTTSGGGTNNDGTVFEITGSGFAALDRDIGEQAARYLTVNWGRPVSAADASAVPFVIGGIEPDDNGTVTFSDGIAAHTVTVDVINGAASGATVDLTGLTGSPITATLHLYPDNVGNIFNDVVTQVPESVLHVTNASHYFGHDYLLGVTSIIFSADNQYAMFAASQFNGYQISSRLTITSNTTSPQTDFIIVALNNHDQYFSAVNWAFTGSPPTIVIEGSSGPQAMIGNHIANTIFYAGDGVDTMTGGAASDTFVFRSLADIHAGDAIDGSGGFNTIAVQNGAIFDFTQSSVSSISEIDMDNAGTTAIFTATQIADIGIVKNNFASNQMLIVEGVNVNLSHIWFENWSASNRVVIHGTAGNDALTGSEVNDTIDGHWGKDTLTGGAGVNTFVFDSVLNKLSNVDHITNFVHGRDKIALSHAIFGPRLALNVSTFYAASHANHAHDADDHIIYNKTTGALYFDKSLHSPAVEFAVLDTHSGTVNYHDFLMVA